MQLEFIFNLGFGQGWGIDRGTWRNQYGYGAALGLRAGFFSFEFNIDRTYRAGV